MIKINFVPFVSSLMMTWLDKYSKKYSYKTVEELLDSFLNSKLVSVLLKVCDISGKEYYQKLSTDDKLLLCQNLKSFPVPIFETKSFSSAQVCNGGVFLSDVSLDTMESKLVKGLYITGELLDINGNCGGYNLTTCWISGMLAGKAIGEVDD